MTPQGREKSKKSRSASADRGAGKSKGSRFAAAPLVIAVLLIGAIALAMGITIQKSNQHAAENATPAVTPESTTPPAAGDPAQAPEKPANPASSNYQSGQTLTN